MMKESFGGEFVFIETMDDKKKREAFDWMEFIGRNNKEKRSPKSLDGLKP